MKSASAPSSVAPHPSDERPVRRVREEVRDGLAVIAFSAAASSALAVVLVVITTLAS